MEDGEAISTISASEKLGNGDEIKVLNNGSCVVENNCCNDLSLEMKGMGTEASESVNLPAREVNFEASPSPATRKGNGLRKWRRIKRDANKVAENRVDTAKLATEGLSSSGANSSKRMQFSEERKQKSEGSVSSTHAVMRRLDGFAVLGDYGLTVGSTFAAGTDSENSEDRSSKSSTAASALKVRYEKPEVIGFPRDKSRMRSQSGKILGNLMPQGQQGKGRIEKSKKARGERVKIEKENSHSSVESDSQSSNVVLMQGNDSATSNGDQSSRLMNYDEENGDEVQGGDQEVGDGLPDSYDGNNGGGSEDISREHLVADSSSEFKEERSENHETSTDYDPLGESIFALQSVQEALEKEVQKFREIGREDVSVDDLVQDLPSQFTSVDPKSYETSSSGHLQSCKHVQSSFHSFPSEVKEIANADMESELEDLFKQKIEVEVEYLVMSKAQTSRVAIVDHVTLPDDQKTWQLGNTENKDGLFEKEAEETLKLQKRVCKYVTSFFIQLLLLVLLLEILVSQLSPNYDGIVPT